MWNLKNTWNIIVTTKIYLLALAIFSFFRVILFANEIDRIDHTVPVSDILYSFIMGIRFDIVISGYIILLPYLLFTIYHLFFRVHIFKKISFYWLFIFFSLAFLVASADIPYFKQFFARFSVTAFEWADSPAFVLKMIAEEPRYWLYIIPYIFSIVLFYKVLRKIVYTENNEPTKRKLWLKSSLSLLFLFIIFIGIRGRLDEKSPIRIGTAYFCNNPFLNQLGLNPNFTLIRSFLDQMKEENKPIVLMEDSLALANVQKYLNVKSINGEFPIQRTQQDIDSIPDSTNIVIVIMESMSAAKMGLHGNKDNLTPFLDSMARSGYYFENAYTAGIHTFNGIFSTIFSYPALFKQHPMKESAIHKYHGIATATKKRGYSSIYFTTHDGQFDNVEGFLLANDFEKVISKKDYPADKVKTTLGVPDDFMFEFAIPVLNKLHQKGKPFLSVFMTASDHGPYYIPEYFQPKNTEIKKQIVEYADFSLKKFIELSSLQPWYQNTLFVFIADHGAPLSALYDLSLDYNHAPLIFYQPNLIPEGKVFSKMAGQIDVYPSIMGLLKIPFDNNTLGINLFNEERPYIYFNADDKYGVIDQTWLLIVKRDHTGGLYKYSEKDLTNYEKQYPAMVKQMKEYAESNLQTFQYLVKKQKI
ncbi:MAG TPA: sulfatase-like hydrolase/transferase [Saprospiraceae bacterium]|nr:sulfatase-like hydrolase/transferase [Saprospiraceae bacterium]